MTQFETRIDPEGNLWLAGGFLVDLTTSPTTTHHLQQPGLAGGDEDAGPFRVVPQLGGVGFCGGSGRNVVTTGTLSGTLAPVGIFRQTGELTWVDQFGTVITFDPSDGSASMDAGATQIATLAAGAATIAPEGSFTSTPDGEDDYNGGTPFSLTAAFEGRNLFPALNLETSDGVTAQAGIYASAGWGAWISAADSDWTLAVDGAGEGTIADATGDVAIRATGADGDGSGIFESTTYGATTYNSGNPFVILASVIPVPAPIAGYLFVTVELAAGVVTGMSGPSFASALPANSATAVHVPIAHSTGTTVYPIQQGPIFWR